MTKPTLFTNGALFDGRRYRGAGEVLVRDGRIAAIGKGALDREDAEIVDLRGGLLAPGFIDAHVHAVQGGMERLQCDLSQVHSREDYLATVRAYADANPGRPWILGGGWGMSAFPGGTPTAADLDAIVPDRPVFLPNRDHHGAWVNSRALELAGLTADTPDPADGRIERDADGRPSGTLHEGAMHAVSHLIPASTDQDRYDGLLEGQRHLHSVGVTGWQDAIIGEYANIEDFGPTYARAATEGDLTAHVVGALWWQRDLGLEQIDGLLERRTALTGGRFRATTVKVMQDGVAENFTAALSAPYLDRCGHATANAGHSFVDAAVLRDGVRRLDAEGFQVHVHAIGDRGVREALDAFEGSSPERRHHIAHLQFIHPDDLARFAKLHVAANLQMYWATYDDQMLELTLPFVGEERSGWQYSYADLERAGTRLVAGSDWPVSTPNPLAAIHIAVNRTAYGEDGPVGTRPFYPEQAISLESAMAAYTSGSAWVNHRDDAGVLREGAVADLVVLDTDPFAGPAAEIGAATVSSTWVDGTAVHRA